jgi:hypothetical protein
VEILCLEANGIEIVFVLHWNFNLSMVEHWSVSFFFSSCLMRPISMIGFIYILGMVLIFMLHYIFVNNDDFFIFLCKSSCS